MKIRLRNVIVQTDRLRSSADGLWRGNAGMAELVDARDSKPLDASHESSSLSPGTKVDIAAITKS